MQYRTTKNPSMIYDCQRMPAVWCFILLARAYDAAFIYQQHQKKKRNMLCVCVCVAVCGYVLLFYMLVRMVASRCGRKVLNWVVYIDGGIPARFVRRQSLFIDPLPPTSFSTLSPFSLSTWSSQLLSTQNPVRQSTEVIKDPYSYCWIPTKQRNFLLL